MNGFVVITVFMPSRGETVNGLGDLVSQGLDVDVRLRSPLTSTLPFTSRSSHTLT